MNGGKGGATSFAKIVCTIDNWPDLFRDGFVLDIYPNQGSHDCNHALCINPAHIHMESAGYNQSRDKCFTLAWLNGPCYHEPPCRVHLKRQ